MLHVQWQQYCSVMERALEASHYHTPLEHRQGGKPIFFISQDQLEYLRSLQFT